VDIHTAEPLVPLPGLVELEIVTGWLKRYKSPGSDRMPVEPIEGGGEILRSEVDELIRSMWNKEELPQQWKESITVPIH
jgi:hypothetical protein